MSNDIKIYISCHKEGYVPENRLLYPIQVGSQLASARFPEMLHDDYGENISHKNPMYCELTCMYWAWKNVTADYYGFFHYRRYFSFNLKEQKEDGYGNVVYNTISDKSLEDLCLDPDYMEEVISSYDVVTVTPRSLTCSVYKQYELEPLSHVLKDLDTVIEIIKEKYPEYEESMTQYLDSSMAYECNMFVMRRDLFHEYCEWLFSILEEHEKKVDFSHYSIEQYRVSGFLGERLWGIFYTHLKKTRKLKRLNLQKALFLDTERQDSLPKVEGENVIPVVMTSSNEYVPYLSTFIQSIVESSNPLFIYDLIVLYKNISLENQKQLTNQLAQFENIRIRFFNINAFFDGLELYIREPFAVETYARLLIPDILPDYEKVIYLDCDMVVKKDLSSLYLENIDGYFLAAVKDADYISFQNADKVTQEYSRDFLELKDPYSYFQAGVLLLNLVDLRKHFTVEYLFKVAQQKDWLYFDQDILNHLCQGRVKFLSQNWNVMMNWVDPNGSRIAFIKRAPRDVYSDYMKARNNPYIIHYAGHIKPWTDPSCDFAGDFWSCARKTPFYEYLLRLMAAEISRSENFHVNRNNLLRRMLHKLFPKGTKRRKIAGKVKRFLFK